MEDTWILDEKFKFLFTSLEVILSITKWPAFEVDCHEWAAHVVTQSLWCVLTQKKTGENVNIYLILL